LNEEMFSEPQGSAMTALKSEPSEIETSSRL